ncbi:MAG: transcriptional regulator [Desulfobacteraceae bacterium]|nr:MAG: transcriptional regulator [Desulfobacteraceae bacterium]
MDNIQFKGIRARLGKTQKQMAQLLGVSIKAIHSYEQGWRKIPHHVERQLFFLVSRVSNPEGDQIPPCWEILNCPEDRLENCPAREFNTGDLCWFINGTCCNGHVHDSWEKKMEECRRCEVFLTQMKGV